MIDPRRPRLLERLRRLRGLAGLFTRDRSGVAAIEFAFVVPILLCMYLMTMEISQGIETNKKLGRAGSLVGDLITQQAEISSSEIDGILQISQSLLQPYNRSAPVITVTALDIGRDPNTGRASTTALWSRRMDGSTFQKPGSMDTTVPSSLLVPGSFLIRVDATLDYRPVILSKVGDKQALGLEAAFDSISMGETYYLRPRRSTTITCTGC